MEKSESITNLVAATIAVMKDVKGIDKSMTIGTGQNAYKGVPDQEVKKIVGEAMVNHGLAIYPISIKPVMKIESWDEQNGNYVKRKQSVFTEVITEYLLCHESGEYITLNGYGHGTDSQDKSAGKATTYSLKYTLLYTFLIPTGKIDDTDLTHSDDIPVAPSVVVPKTVTEPEIKWMTNKQFNAVKKLLTSVDNADFQKGKANFEAFQKEPYDMTKEQRDELQNLIDTF